EFGFVEVLGVPAQRQAVLAGIRGVAVGRAADRVAAADADDLGGGGRTVLRGQVAKAVGRQVAGGAVEAGRPVQLGVVDRLRGGAEAQHHVAAARRGEVVG